MHGGVWITAARERANLTIEELAERTGYSVEQITDWEYRREPILHDTLVAVVAATGWELRIGLRETPKVDIAQVQACLRLTPQQRLDQAMSGANALMPARNAALKRLAGRGA